MTRIPQGLTGSSRRFRWREAAGLRCGQRVARHARSFRTGCHATAPEHIRSAEPPSLDYVSASQYVAGREETVPMDIARPDLARKKKLRS